MKHAKMMLVVFLLISLSLAGCSKKPGNDLLNMKFSKVYVGGWMMETVDKSKAAECVGSRSKLPVCATNVEVDLSEGSFGDDAKADHRFI
jgi:hypothetical protein